MFGLSSLTSYAVIAAVAIAMAGGAYFYVYHQGQTDERNSNAGRILVETEADRRLREHKDADARSLDDERALLCLRNPSGCQR